MSKGSDRRKPQVPPKVIDDNWNRIFKKDKKDGKAN